MERKAPIACIASLLMIALPLMSCVNKKAPLKPEASSDASASPDAAADAALGTLPEEESEIRRQLRELEEKEEAEKAIREQEERERREEERRVHRTLTDDQTLSKIS